jgi:site-specific recombinase XerD
MTMNRKLRRDYALSLYKQTKDILYVKRMLGHKNIETSFKMIYRK